MEKEKDAQLEDVTSSALAPPLPPLLLPSSLSSVPPLAPSVPPLSVSWPVAAYHLFGWSVTERRDRGRRDGDGGLLVLLPAPAAIAAANAEADADAARLTRCCCSSSCVIWSSEPSSDVGADLVVIGMGIWSSSSSSSASKDLGDHLLRCHCRPASCRRRADGTITRGCTNDGLLLRARALKSCEPRDGWRRMALCCCCGCGCGCGVFCCSCCLLLRSACFFALVLLSLLIFLNLSFLAEVPEPPCLRGAHESENLPTSLHISRASCEARCWLKLAASAAGTLGPAA